MERKFTDAEIVKALECCREKDCGDCPMGEYPQTICEWDAFDLAIDLINRQKAEIEELTKLLRSRHRAIEHLEGVIVSLPDQVRSEAIKGFADRRTAEIAHFLKAVQFVISEKVREGSIFCRCAY